MKQYKIISVVGTRPQLIKAACVTNEINKCNIINEAIIHTGQHYDKSMSEFFFVNFKKKIKFLKFKFLIYHFKNKLIKYLIKFISFKKILYLVRGSKINFEIELNSKKKEFINYHSHDFSRVNLYKKKNKK